MKFTNGYWLLKENISSIYAVEYAGHEIHGDTLTVYAAQTHIRSRADTLNIGLLTLTITSPQENILHTELTHFAGAAKQAIRPEVSVKKPEVHITETETHLIYRSGSLEARICKAPSSWGIAYYDGNTRLTSTGYRNQARMFNRDTCKSYMVEQLSIDIGESIYGLGERFTPFVKNGQTVSIWNEDGGTSSEQTYINLPFYITSKGYGIMVDTFSDLEFEIASEKVECVQFSVPGETLGYYVIAGGSPKGTISRYCQLTGMPALPPAWSFGLWLTTSFSTNYDEATTSSFVQGMADREIPLRVFHFDCFWMRAYRWCDFLWDPDTFPDPAGMIRRYHEKGLQVCLWINPYIGQMSYLFKEGMEHGYLLKKENGDIWQTDLWQPGLALVDFTNPDAAAWYASKLEALLDIGVDCFKTDFGERIPVRGVHWFDGSDANAMHNRYTHLYNRTVFDLLERKRGKGESVLFARSATVGGQQFPVHWGGDCSATYASMSETLRGGLSLACGGFGFWSHDISGFEQVASPDIYKRWCQFGLLSSHSRLHGSTTYRVPWLFDEEACIVLKEMVELKCKLMPYLFQQAVDAHETGVPMLRPMFLEFPQDRSCHNLDLQYMLGSSLLAAPIFRDDGWVEYYLPHGKWINLFTGETLEGGRWHQGQFDYHSMPLLVAPNTILPMGSCGRKPDYDYADGVSLCLSHFEDGATAEVRIPDLHGNTIMTASACRSGNIITLEVQGAENWSCKLLGGEADEICRNSSTARIRLKGI